MKTPMTLARVAGLSLLSSLASEPEKRHITRMDRERIALLEQAAELLGGQRALARALDVSERSVRAWLAGERNIGDGVLRDVQAALVSHAELCLGQSAAIAAHLA